MISAYRREPEYSKLVKKYKGSAFTKLPKDVQYDLWNTLFML